MYNGFKEYVVTLKDYNSLDQFYLDIETEGTTEKFIPSRSVQCVSRRPTSRNTIYLLSDDEARAIILDPRVESVDLKSTRVFKKVNHSEQTGVWNRSETVSPGQKNWGLYRMQLDANDGSWGSDIGDPERTSTIKINGTGKNVDIVVVDQVLYPDHPEFSGRVVEYDWFRQHDLAVRGNATTIVSISRFNNEVTVTTAEPHRIRTGHLVDIVCTSDASFNVTAASVIVTTQNGVVTTPTQFRYSNTGINVTDTPAEGYWRGVYQYPSYTGSNNHATAVASVIAGDTQGWARDANIYNLRYDLFDTYTPAEYLIDYIRQFHLTKSINPTTGRKNPTLVNNSWGFVNDDLLFLSNIYTGNPSYSKLSYRGGLASPLDPTLVDTGISGVCSSSALLGTFSSVAPGTAYSIITDATTATVSPITFAENGTVGLLDLGAPGSSSAISIDANDDATWQLSLPFAVNYLDTPYQNNVYVSSNSMITFAAVFNGFPEFAPGAPAANKIFISAGDRNVKTLWGGVIGTAPNRTYILRYEGWDGAYSSLYEFNDPSLIWETVFYENNPARIDIRFIENSVYRAEFSFAELNQYGLLTSNPKPVPIRLPDLDADVSDAIANGIIFVGSAGNSSTKIDISAGVDYNNYVLENGEPIYYHRGSSPANSHPDAICVGSLDSASQESKNQLSNAGPGVDLYAPGVNIISAVFDGSGGTGELLDEGAGRLYQKWSGTSIASAQVAGLIAIALETYPAMNQAEAKSYILKYAKEGEMFDSAGGYTDTVSLQSGPNKLAYYYKERQDTGMLVPKTLQWLRPTTGQLYPRPQIRKK